MDLNIIKEKLQNNEKITINIEDIKTQHSLKLLSFQRDSYKNLFMSYINATTESANEFNLQKFLDIYVASEIKIQDLVLSVLHKNIGKELTDEIYYGEKPKKVFIINDYKEIIIR